MRKKLTTSEKIRNAVACQEVENLHARHCFMHCAGRNIEETDNYWSHDPGVSWGHAFGKWTSWTGVKFGWGGSLERKGTLAFLQLTQVWPQIAGLDPRPIQESAIHMLATDIIEVAADGKTARAYFYTPGAICSMLNTNRQRKCFLMWERYGIEYVCEDGQWKFFTIQVCPDIMAPMDTVNPAASSYQELVGKAEAGPGLVVGSGQLAGGGGPSDPILDETEPVHVKYSLIQPVQNPVPWPEPYDTFDQGTSYRLRVKDYKK